MLICNLLGWHASGDPHDKPRIVQDSRRIVGQESPPFESKVAPQVLQPSLISRERVYAITCSIVLTRIAVKFLLKISEGERNT